MLELRHFHKTWEPLESAKKANKSGSRPKTYRLSSKVSFGAGCRVQAPQIKNVLHNNRLAFGVLYLNRLSRLPCSPVV
jgi:hypothetical protein